MRFLVALVLTGALAVVGCGDGETNGTGGTGGGAGASGGSGGTGGSAGTGGSGGSPALINGCIESEALDMTSMANVTITDENAWVVPHSACIRVSANTVVTWKGNFTAHPLAGGETPTRDEASPISEINANSGTEDASVTLDTAGTYPYFCEFHTFTMQGVIYVE